MCLPEPFGEVLHTEVAAFLVRRMALNRLGVRVGRSRYVNMFKSGYSNEPETCEIKVVIKCLIRLINYRQ